MGMKLAALLLGSAYAEWNGVSEDNSCGLTLSGDSMINSTCTWSGSHIKHVFAGNGAFITGPQEFTGYEEFTGVSDDAAVVVFFNQDCSSGECDNSTCWDASISCVDNGAPTTEKFFMESVNDHRMAKGSNVNLQIYGVSNGDTLTIQLNTGSGLGWACQNITAPFGTVSVTDGPGVMFGDLFQITVTQQPGEDQVLNLW